MKILPRGLLYVALLLAITRASTAHAAYWSLFNFEGEGVEPAIYVTYATLADMLIDENRTGTFVPNGFGSARNVIGSGSSGSAYWSLFNFEGEGVEPAIYVTYATLADMLIDENRTGTFVPNGFGSARNVIGSGSDNVPSVSIPEPGTLALLGLGLGLAGFCATRRREQ